MKPFFQIITSFVLLLLVFIFITSLFFTRIHTPTGSMLPTIQIGEELIIKKQNTNFERLDIVVFHSEDQTLLLKRIIGLGGETIEFKDGTLYINNVYFPEPYLGSTDHYSGSFTVPSGSYFLLGDNRADSNDARYWIQPYTTENQITGKVVLRLYPWLQFIP